MSIFNNKDTEKIISPVTFTKPGKITENPLSFMEKDINSETNFAILKTTDNGKWVRGNMLFYSLNGVEIYTDLNNIIFVNTRDNTLFVREYDRVLNEIAPDDPEQKQYILLYTDLGFEEGNEDFQLRWEAVSGRTNAYENIKVNASVIDIDKSLVLAETVSFKDSLTVRQFMEYVKNAGFIEDDNFEIGDFAGSDFI